MDIKNSAGVKLPNAELVIEADPDGTVTSCRDVLRGIEYVDEYSGLETVEVTITNNRSSNVTFYYATTEDGYIKGLGSSLSSGGSTTRTILKSTYVIIGSTNTQWSIISGDAEIVRNNTLLVKGDCSVAFENV